MLIELTEDEIALFVAWHLREAFYSTTGIDEVSMNDQVTEAVEALRLAIIEQRLAVAGISDADQGLRAAHNRQTAALTELRRARDALDELLVAREGANR